MASSTAHTAGPWNVTGGICDVGRDTVHRLWCGDIHPPRSNIYRGTIAHIQSCAHLGANGTTNEEAEANARLIAAAPELLAALEALLEEAINFSVSGVYFDEECMGHKGPALARAAIAAAKSEPPTPRAFYGAECPSYPNCNGGCGLGCTHEIESARGAKGGA
jgi:hypothetical protein